MPEYRALLLGNGNYAPDSGLAQSGTDLKILKAALTDEDTSLFGQPDVTDKTDLDAHQVRLLIADFFGTGQPGDQLLLYYSGHGVKSLEEELYLCAANTTLGVRLDATAVSASYVHKRIQESSATAKVLVLDCCYAGAFKSADEQPWPRQGAACSACSAPVIQPRPRTLSAWGSPARSLNAWSMRCGSRIRTEANIVSSASTISSSIWMITSGLEVTGGRCECC